MNPIVIKNLKKNYDDTPAVKGVSFEVGKGEIFGLIGPDGAGKTTILRTLVSLLIADEGEVLFKGSNVREHPTRVRSQIGYMPQRFSLYRDLTVEENLRFFGDLFKVPKSAQEQRMKQLYDFSQLEPFKNRRADALSGGMKQKLALSCMLMHDPEVIVLDEPTYGVDPVSRQEFWDILKSLAEQGTSLLVSTAYMDEAMLCDRVGLIYDGEILAMDEPAALLKTYDEKLYLLEADDLHAVFERLQESGFSGQYALFGDGLHISDKENLGLQAAKKRLDEMQIDYSNFQEIEPNLEDLFLKLMPEKNAKGE